MAKLLWAKLLCSWYLIFKNVTNFIIFCLLCQNDTQEFWILQHLDSANIISIFSFILFRNQYISSAHHTSKGNIFFNFTNSPCKTDYFTDVELLITDFRLYYDFLAPHHFHYCWNCTTGIIRCNTILLNYQLSFIVELKKTTTGCLNYPVSSPTCTMRDCWILQHVSSFIQLQTLPVLFATTPFLLTSSPPYPCCHWAVWGAHQGQGLSLISICLSW